MLTPGEDLERPWTGDMPSSAAQAWKRRVHVVVTSPYVFVVVGVRITEPIARTIAARVRDGDVCHNHLELFLSATSDMTLAARILLEKIEVCI